MSVNCPNCGVALRIITDDPDADIAANEWLQMLDGIEGWVEAAARGEVLDRFGRKIKPERMIKGSLPCPSCNSLLMGSSFSGGPPSGMRFESMRLALA